jgi:exopolysaccharide/PEP-CTERM locus tyrosine autokinase
MDDDKREKGRKRGKRGSLIERAGAVYDFEGILRARIVVPPDGSPGEIIDVTPQPAPPQPAAPPKPELTRPVTEPQLPPLQPQPIPSLAGGYGAPPPPPPPPVTPSLSAPPPSEPPALGAPDIVYKTAKVDRAELIDQGFIMPDAAITALAEEFRIVKRTLLLNAIGPTALPKGRRILICSAQANEGKTFCAVNLALSMANERDTEVLLIDGDFAKPTVLATLGIEGPIGLMDALADPSIDVESLIIKTDVGSLSVLPSGKYTNEATELIAADHTRNVVERLAAKPNRIVLFDSPPALAASPASVLAYHVGQVLLVVQADRTGESELRDATLLLGGCEEIQLLLNRVRFSPSSRRFGSYYGYEAPR